MSNKILYSELVKTVYLDPIYLQEGDEPLVFKIEIVKLENGKLRPFLWRLESYKLQPSFLNGQSDEAYFVKDEHTIPEIDDIVENTEAGALNFLLKKISEKFFFD